MHHTKIMQQSHGFVSDMLTMMVQRWGYGHVILIKDALPTLSAIFIGILIGTFIMVYVGKDARLLADPDAEEMMISAVRKNGRRKVLISVPKYKALNLKFITAVSLYVIMAFVRLRPIGKDKKIQVVDNFKLRFMFISTVTLLLAFCIFTIYVDFHSIVPDGNGGYKILEFKH